MSGGLLNYALHVAGGFIKPVSKYYKVLRIHCSRAYSNCTSIFPLLFSCPPTASCPLPVPGICIVMPYEKLITPFRYNVHQ